MHSRQTLYENELVRRYLEGYPARKYLIEGQGHGEQREMVERVAAFQN